MNWFIAAFTVIGVLFFGLLFYGGYIEWNLTTLLVGMGIFIFLAVSWLVATGFEIMLSIAWGEHKDWEREKIRLRNE